MFFTYQGNKLYYKVIGQGKPVLAIHGLGCSSELMEGCLEPIFEKHAGYKRIYLDLPGMGRSDANPAFARRSHCPSVGHAPCRDRHLLNSNRQDMLHGLVFCMCI